MSIHPIIYTFLFSVLLLSCSKPENKDEIDVIAHAGGGLNGKTYLNSFEAIDFGYSTQGYRLFEIDMNWTNDGVMVMIHDWSSTFSKYFPEWNKGTLPSYSEFMTLNMADGQTQLDLNGLINILKKYPDMRVVTDIKSDNLGGLKLIKQEYPEYNQRFIPQIYSFGEYQSVIDLGYTDIILTLYRTGASDSEVVQFANSQSLYAVTVYSGKLDKTDLAERLVENGHRVFVHTLNSISSFKSFYDRGVTGVYTDYLSNEEVQSLARANDE